MNHGRPTRLDQTQLQQELRKYFDYGVTATLAAEKVGVNIKTVCKYFDEWSNSIEELRSNEYMVVQKAVRARMIASYDKQIIETIDLSNELNNEIQKLKKWEKTDSALSFRNKVRDSKIPLGANWEKISSQSTNDARRIS